MTELEFPRDAWHQHRYPRLRGASIGTDGEVTVHICRGLPCCGLDLLIEHKPDMPAVDLYRIAGLFARFCDAVEQVPSFAACQVDGPATAAE